MKELLGDARKRNYGVGFFNTFNMDMARAVIHAAEECNSPVIIGTAEALLKFGSFDWSRPAGRRFRWPCIWTTATALRLSCRPCRRAAAP